jgi:hypothetical protein
MRRLRALPNDQWTVWKSFPSLTHTMGLLKTSIFEHTMLPTHTKIANRAATHYRRIVCAATIASPYAF